MKREEKITLSEWNELTDEEKEQLRNWALKHSYELDLVPNNSGTFDPTCDYAALLTYEQILIFLQENIQEKIMHQKKTEITQEDCSLLWKHLVKKLRQ